MVTRLQSSPLSPAWLTLIFFPLSRLLLTPRTALSLLAVGFIRAGLIIQVSFKWQCWNCLVLLETVFWEIVWTMQHKYWWSYLTINTYELINAATILWSTSNYSYYNYGETNRDILALARGGLNFRSITNSCETKIKSLVFTPCLKFLSSTDSQPTVDKD